MGREDLQQIQLKIGAIVKDLWQVCRKLGEGGCGVVYEVVNIKNPNSHAAMKIEPFGMLKDDEMLKMEVYVLKKMQNSKHACKLLLSGKAKDYFFMIMSLLGKSLGELRRACPDQRFTLSTSIRLAMQCLEAIEEIHDAGFIHRDIKPSNFALGRNRMKRNVYLLDFGLARQYKVR
ncbi:hypothetical protein AB6A40_010496 [Gnathostoma spinigerum]|uniref:Protein kinase domain-containing protein n=1 Tax=Gnathostoma spinigerum TaxID=75299 RepID=A0ABD6EXF5_9BILA